ncbi:MAG: SGNH/GDSL hydrolase family protein [Clostridia bacterium]|nr:SGNH/GDSL hydrolase family protein [Clostridia bacterium]
MAQEKDNTVSSKNQLKEEDKVFGEKRNGKKILFLGNSITRHGEAPQIGWYGNWGMAASSEDKDYVHQTMKRVWDISPNASFLVAQIADWEREYWNDKLIEEKFPETIAYGADIIIVRVAENIRSNDNLKEAYEKLISTIDPKGTAKVIMTTMFWVNPERDKIIKAVATDGGHKLVDVCIGADDRYTAKGKFEHAGVAAHPGDEGMEEIAIRIFDAIKEYL